MTNKMQNYGKPKRIVGMRLYLKAIILGNFLLFNFFIFLLIKFFISNYDKAVENGTAVAATIIIVGVTLLCMLFAYVLPYFLLKRYAKIKYYDDGFTYGKGEKVLYENLDYFFIPNTMKPNTFISIWFKDNQNVWKVIPSIGYPTNGFEEFQQDFVNINYAKAMEKIDNGETLEFLFNNPKKKIVAVGAKNFIKSKLDKAIKVKINRETLIFGNETYRWNEYKIVAANGFIIIKDKNDNRILSLSDKAMVHRVNLLEALISRLSKN